MDKKELREFLDKTNVEISKLFQKSEDFDNPAINHWIDVYYKLMIGELDTTNTYPRFIKQEG